MQITIYHHPNCGTSRNVLAAIRAAGHEPRIVEYLKTPFTRDELRALIARMNIKVRDLVRTKEALYSQLGLDGRDVSDAELLDAMVAHPLLINRPIVTTKRDAKLCRPRDVVQGLLEQSDP